MFVSLFWTKTTFYKNNILLNNFKGSWEDINCFSNNISIHCRLSMFVSLFWTETTFYGRLADFLVKVTGKLQCRSGDTIFNWISGDFGTGLIILVVVVSPFAFSSRVRWSSGDHGVNAVVGCLGYKYIKLVTAVQWIGQAWCGWTLTFILPDFNHCWRTFFWIMKETCSPQYL